MRSRLLWLPLVLLLLGFAPPGGETSADDEIRATLARWADAFNDGKADAVCSLFAPELRYNYPGFPERGYEQICALLHRSLDDESKRYTYKLDIREIIVSGDIAVVRLVWTLEIRKPGSPADPVRSIEPGMDIFRRQADGNWKIIRYLAYEER